ncbi:MAG: DUF2961 domain-containing protein [Pirellulaceae bacterium]|nr:DUF2961 domain-containing protein [Pirellulaceae bacterium]
MSRFFPLLSTACLVGVSLLLVNPTAGQTPLTDGETSAIRDLHELDHLPRLLSGVTARMFSSYDRTGGNDDGFKGTYSKLRVENGNSVLAEMTGAGCIERIHLPHSIYAEPGLLGRKGEHIRIYLDGNTTPALDVPLEDIFRGKVDGFPKPLVGEGDGGHYCYVPIPYRDGCKVVVEGTDVRFYAVQYRTYPSAEGVVTFTNPPTDRQREALATAAKAWSSCGDFESLGVVDPERVEKTVEVKPGEPVEVSLPDGPRMVRAMYVSGSPEALKEAGGVRLTIRWDGSEKPAVDVPLDCFFCQAMQPGLFRSLLAGSTESGWYNFMPMPYGKTGVVTLTSEKPFACTLAIVTTTLPEWKGDFGYLHAAYHEGLPPEPDVYHPWATREGRGHYIGTYMATDGQTKVKMPTWLEGDEVFTCDGELRIHGTGTEDYFNCGWYATPGRLMGPCAYPLHGFPVYRIENDRNVAVAFRWHVADPIPYEKSLEAKVEHGATNRSKANYRSVGFFYDAAP